MGTLIIGTVLVLSGIALGWWLKGRFGARAAADLQAVSNTASKL